MFKQESHIGRLGVNAKFPTCCNQGEVDLEQIKDPPIALQNLFTEPVLVKDFRSHMRSYNS